MLYHDHGLNRVFTSYEDYFGGNVDGDAVAYLQVANDLARAVSPDVVTIAEDVSGMPGMARPVAEGGLGFDYRLAMGIPDYWTKLIKETPDEGWPLGAIYHELLDRRPGEKRVGYVESHDQSLVGDQTLAFRLMGQEMYWNMGKDSDSPVVERGIALLKLIRLLTFSLAGEAWLNVHRQRVRAPRMGGLPARGQRLLLPPRPAAVVAGGQPGPALRGLERVRPGDAGPGRRLSACCRTR